MSRYTIALIYGIVSPFVVFLILVPIVSLGNHWYTGPVIFSFWGLWFGSLLLFRCPKCRRSVFIREFFFPFGPLPEKQCTKCGTDLTVKTAAEKVENNKADKQG